MLWQCVKNFIADHFNPNLGLMGSSIVVALVWEGKVLLIFRNKDTERGELWALVGGMTAKRKVPFTVGTRALKSAPRQYPEPWALGLARQLKEEVPWLFSKISVEGLEHYILAHARKGRWVERKPAGWVAKAGGIGTINKHCFLPYDPSLLGDPHAIGSNGEVRRHMWADFITVAEFQAGHQFAFPEEDLTAMEAVKPPDQSFGRPH